VRFLYARIVFKEQVDFVLINPALVLMVRWHHPEYSSVDCTLHMVDGSTYDAHIKRERLEELGLPIKED
jgi:hypothetical protein